MTFRAAPMLLLLVGVPLVALLLWSRERIRERVGRRFASERLRGASNTLRPLRPWMLTIALLLAIVALAGPTRGFTVVPIAAREANRIVLLDVSNSMLAQDVGTSRLFAAKAIARRLIDAHPGRVALIEFELSPEVVSPLTSDNDAVISLLDSVGADDVGEPGSDIGAAVLSAIRLADAEPTAKADLVVISDGEDQTNHVADAVRLAKQKGITVSAVLVGTAEGSTIPLPGGELRDENGNVVTTRAHAEGLQALAGATGGAFLENPFSERALDPLLTVRGRGAQRQRNVKIPIDRYQWPLTAAFALLIIGSLANRGAE